MKIVRKMITLVFAVLVISAIAFTLYTSPKAESSGDTYYVSSSQGDDNNDGLSASSAWKSLEKVSSGDFHPGDKILFKAGDEWEGSLKLTNIEGTKQAPIIFDKYDSSGLDDRPVLNGNGTTSDEPYSIYTYYDGVEDKTQSATIDVLDGSYLEFNNFEVTNYNEDIVSQRAGIAIKTSAFDQEEWEDNAHQGITIKNNYVHDVNGDPYGQKMGSGGILLLGNISDVLVDNNKVTDVDIEGIRNAGLYKEGDIPENFPKVLDNIQFRNNDVARVQGDGMVMSNIGKNGLMEYNTVKEFANKDVGDVNYAGLWVMAVKDTTVQYNEVYDGKYGYDDGEAFDIDMFSEGALFQYNYSHNNNGGFMLFMDGSVNSVVRYNVSVNDGGGDDQEIFHYLPQSEDDAPLIHNNTFFTESDMDTQLFRNDLGETIYPELYNNAFMSQGEMAMGETTYNGGNIRNNAFYPGKDIDDDALSGASFEDNQFEKPNYLNPGAEPEQLVTDADTFDTEALMAYQVMEDSPLINAGTDVTDITPSTWEKADYDFFHHELYGQEDIGANANYQLEISANGILNLVEQFEEKGEIKSHDIAHLLKLHLFAVERYEKANQTEKVVQHMKSFKELLQKEKDNNKISDNAHQSMSNVTDSVMEKWEW